MHRINKKLITTLLFFEIIAFSIEGDYYYNYDNKKVFCSNIETGCEFEISNSNPFSPKIPTENPYQAILNEYRYIYLIFNIPKNAQKKFYLMAYDTSDKKTIISNGDYYEIDLSVNTDYEIRIYKELKEERFIEFLFLGLSSNFRMKVEIRFKLDINLYFNDYKLDNDNSLNSNRYQKISNYYKEIQTKLKKRYKIVEDAIFNINQILRKHFDISMSFSAEDLNSSETIFIAPCFLVTATYGTELDTSLSMFMQDTEDDFVCINGIIFEENDKVNYKVDGSDLIKDLMKEDNNVIKTFQSYFGNIESFVLESNLKYEQLCLTVSTNFKSVKYTLSFSLDHKYIEQIYYIEIEIEITNPIINKPAPVYSYGINWNNVGEKVKPILKGVIYVLSTAGAIAALVNGIDASNLIPELTL